MRVSIQRILFFNFKHKIVKLLFYFTEINYTYIFNDIPFLMKKSKLSQYIIPLNRLKC